MDIEIINKVKAIVDTPLHLTDFINTVKNPYIKRQLETDVTFLIINHIAHLPLTTADHSVMGRICGLVAAIILEEEWKIEKEIKELENLVK